MAASSLISLHRKSALPATENDEDEEAGEERERTLESSLFRAASLALLVASAAALTAAVAALLAAACFVSFWREVYLVALKMGRWNSGRSRRHWQ